MISMSIVSSSCLLCFSSNLKDVRERYWHCLDCDFIFLDPAFRLSAEAEKERYLKHHNSLADSGYVQFLQKMVDQLLIENSELSSVPACAPKGDLDSVLRPNPVSALESAPVSVLDYGSGPEPILAQMVQSLGFQVQMYDPFFSANKNVLTEKYNFILLNEVLEHFYDPLRELSLLQGLLHEGGKIIVQTQLHRGEEHFADWWYPRDPTHVSFFSKKALHEGLPKMISEKVVLVAPAADKA